MRLYFTFLFLLCTSIFIAQTTADFESFEFPSEGYLNGSDGSMGFSDGNISLPNSYNSGFDSWVGWAISSTTDSTTAGYLNQFSSITGGGAEGSANYAVSYIPDGSEGLLFTTGVAAGGIIEGFHINNSTYAYLSMRDGDSVGKKFGGEDGSDPDYFYLSIKEFGARNVNNDSLIIYLADYRFDDNAEDYILSEWTYVDLTQFENVDTLSFKMYSSDVGLFGVNTPTYFCMDNLVTADRKATDIKETEIAQPKIFPNPFVDIVFIDGNNIPSSYVLHDIYGKVVSSGTIDSSIRAIDLTQMSSGSYILKTQNSENQWTSQLLQKF